MRTIERAPRRWCLLALSAVVAVATGSARGAFIWIGSGGNDDWNTGGNWNTGVAPVGMISDSIVFGPESGNFQVTGANGAYTDILGISFTGANGSYTIGGSGSFAIADGFAVRNDSTSTQTINLDIIGTGANLQLFADQGDLHIGGDVDLSDTGGVLLTVSGDQATVITGVISGAGGSLDKVGNGMLTLSGANTYDGVTSLVAGGIVLGNDAALGTSDFQVTGNAAIQSTSDSRNIANTVQLIGSTLAVGGNNGLTLSGVVSGTGGLQIIFNGDDDTLTLTGANTYTGGTELTRGTLVVGDDDALGTGDLTVSGNATLQSDNDGRRIGNDVTINAARMLTVNGMRDLELTGTIQGAGGLIKDGSMTLTLSGTNTYTGMTRIEDGTLQVDAGDAILDTGTVSIADAVNARLTLLDDETIGSLSGGGTTGGAVDLGNFTLTIAETGMASFDGTITGAGTLELSGDGTLLLGAANDHGETLVSGDGATLGIGDDEALGAGMLRLTANATLMPYGGERTVANDISIETDELEISGAVAVEFSGNVTLTDPTTTFDVTSTAAVDFSGVIDDGGGVLGLTKVGAGTLTLSGVNTYTGLTSVDEGTLLVDGSVAGDLDVNDTGVLGGTGSIGGNLTNFSGGTVSPGDPGEGPGTLTVAGNYDQQAGSTLDVDVNAEDGSSDLLAVTGTATLAADSTINATIASDTFIVSGETFTILTADGGIFDNGVDITTQSATMAFVLIRQGDFMDGDLAYILEAFRSPTAYVDAAQGRNNMAIGSSLDSLVPVANTDPTGDAAQLLGRLDVLNASQVNMAIGELSPASYNVATLVGMTTTAEYATTQSEYLQAKREGDEALAVWEGMDASRMASASADPLLLAAALAAQDDAEFEARTERNPWGVYARGLWVWSNQDTEGDMVGYNGNTYGGQAGLDLTFSPELIAGASVGYTHTKADFKDDAGDLDVDTFRVGPYMTYTKGGWYFDASVTLGLSDYDGTRNIPTLGLQADSDYSGWDLSGYIGGGAVWQISNAWALRPTASLQYTYFDYDSYTETGADGADLHVNATHSDSLRSRLGVNLTARSKDGTGPVFIDFFIGWSQEYLDNDSIESSFVGGGNPFVVQTGSRDKASVYLGLGSYFLLKNNSAAFLRYEGDFSSGGNVQTITGGLSLRF